MNRSATRFRVIGPMGGLWIAAPMPSDHGTLEPAIEEGKQIAAFWRGRSAIVLEYRLDDPERRRVVALIDSEGNVERQEGRFRRTG